MQVASRQYGVMTTQHLRDAGLTEAAIEHRTNTGRLIRLHRGVYAVGHLGLHERAPAAAALLACGEGAMLSHHSAAELWGLGRATDVEVTVPARRHPQRAGITVHRSDVDPSDVRRKDGLLLTSPARTLLDLTAAVSASHLEHLVAEAHARRLVDLTELSHRGAERLRTMSEGGPRRTRSEAERALLRLIERAGLPKPRTNVHIAGHEVDAVWDDERVAVEVDGFAAHGHRTAFERDRRRDADLRDAGFTPVRLTWRQLEHEPERTTAHLARLLAAPFWIRSRGELGPRLQR